MRVPTLDNPEYIVDGDMSADLDGGWIDCDQMVAVAFHVEWSAVALTDGTLQIHGSNDPSQTLYQALTISTFHGTFPTVGATAAGAIVVVQNPPRFLRLSYVRTAGGAADQMQAFAYARGA